MRVKIAAVLCCGVLRCGKPSQPTPIVEDRGVKILQFYPRESMITEGDTTVLCYGVANAKSVRIDPPVEGVWVSRNHCAEIQPKRTTHYTLIAEGADGRTTSESLTIGLAANTATLPRVTEFGVTGCSRDYAGKPVFSVSFADQNAEEISIDPPAFPTLHGSPFGHFYVSPEKNTTYTLSVTGKHGHIAKKTLSLNISECK